MVSKTIIIGAGTGARLLLNLFSQFYKGEIKVVGLIDDNKNLQGKIVEGVKVIGTSNDLERIAKSKKADSFIVGIGCSNMHARKELFEKAKKLGLKPVNAIHKTAVIDKTAELGKGITIFANATVNTGAKIKDNVTIYSGAVVEHDCVLEEHVYISPGVCIAGTVHVGKNTFIGIGANIIQGIRIGENSVIGAGACVLEDIPKNVVAAGVPAKVIRENTGSVRI